MLAKAFWLLADDGDRSVLETISRMTVAMSELEVLQALCEGSIDRWRKHYFGVVEADVWEFHVGGYQVLEKWLKDRKGRKLTWDDQQHYQKIVVALKETMRLMGEIDESIAAWPIS